MGPPIWTPTARNVAYRMAGGSQRRERSSWDAEERDHWPHRPSSVRPDGPPGVTDRMCHGGWAVEQCVQHRVGVDGRRGQAGGTGRCRFGRGRPRKVAGHLGGPGGISASTNTTGSWVAADPPEPGARPHALAWQGCGAPVQAGQGPRAYFHRRRFRPWPLLQVHVDGVAAGDTASSLALGLAVGYQIGSLTEDQVTAQTAAKLHRNITYRKPGMLQALDVTAVDGQDAKDLCHTARSLLRKSPHYGLGGRPA